VTWNVLIVTEWIYEYIGIYNEWIYLNWRESINKLLYQDNSYPLLSYREKDLENFLGDIAIDGDVDVRKDDFINYFEPLMEEMNCPCSQGSRSYDFDYQVDYDYY